MKYLGPVASSDVFLIVENPKYLFAYIDTATSINLPFKNSVAYLGNLTSQVKAIFGSSLVLKFCDIEMEAIENTLHEEAEFFIFVSVATNDFNSRSTH